MYRIKAQGGSHHPDARANQAKRNAEGDKRLRVDTLENAVKEKRGSHMGADVDRSPFVHDGILAVDACTVRSQRINRVLPSV